MRPYADTNFFARLYLPLPQSEEALALARTGTGVGIEKLPLTWLVELELTNAIEHYVFLTRSSGQIRVTQEAAAAAQANLVEDLERADFVVSTVLEEGWVKRQFKELAFRHTARHGYRTYDLLHVSSALLLGCDTFWSFDLKARTLAESEGLAVNPISPNPPQ